ncbi:amidohydrolase family protein, partial [Pseudomonadales bacterium]|nr:amidohydrolase family protein [Pseudomonadales bacterium]
MTLETAETIDVHAHAVLEATMGAAGAHGPTLSFDERPKFTVANYELTGVKYRGSPFMDPDLRIQSMDRAGIDFQILSPNPLTYFHFIDAVQGQAFCRTHNDALADLVQVYPERLAAFASVPMQDIGFAVEELERAVRELGFLGAYIGTDFGMPLNDVRLNPFYEKLVDLNVPLFIHPAPAGIDGPLGDAN